METLASLIGDTLLTPLLNPAVIALTTVFTLALLSGFVARVIEVFEEVTPKENCRTDTLDNRESAAIDN